MKYHYQDLSKFTLPDNFRGRSKLSVQFWWFVQSTLFGLSPQVLYSWRRKVLRNFGAKIGKKVLIRPSVTVTYPWKLQIGDFSWIGDHVKVYSLGEISIGSNAVISQKSYLCTGSHNYKNDKFEIYSKKITIENEVWVGADVFVGPGVKIGKAAVVGSRSTVFKDLPPHMVCFGNPAKPIRRRI